MKRRVLSIALVLCMLCALIPASVAFAAEPTYAAADEPGNTKVVYGLIPSILTVDNTAFFKEVISPAYHVSSTISNIYNGTVPGTAAITDTHGGFWRFHSRLDHYGSTSIRYSEWAMAPYADTSGNGPYNYYAIAFNVPKDGYYDVTFAIKSGTPSFIWGSAEGRFSYMIHDGDATSATIYNTAANVKWDGSAVTGTKGTHYLGVVSNISGEQLTDTSEDVWLTKGEHILAIHALSGVVAYPKCSFDYFMISQGDANVGAPMGEAITTVDNSDLKIGGDTAQAGYSAGKLYNSATWETYTVGKVTYESSDNNVATVDADTGVITPVGKGTAEITALIDGFPTTPVTVNVATTPGISVVYGARSDVAPSGSDYYNEVLNGKILNNGTVYAFYDGAPVLSYDKTNGLWRAYSKYGRYDSAYFHSSNAWVVIQSYASEVNNYYAFAFNVPKDGYYDLTVNLGDDCPGNASYGRSYVSYFLFDSGVTDAEIKSAVVDSSKRDGTLCTINNEDKSLTDTKNVYLTAGEHVIAFNAHDGTAAYYSYVINNFKISQGSGTVNAPVGMTTVNKTDLYADGNEDQKTAQAGISAKLYGSRDWSSYTAGNTTYASSDNAVATIDENGVITAKGMGSADIYAIVDGYRLTPVKVNVTAQPGPTITYGSVYGDGSYYWNNVILDIAQNTDISPNVWTTYLRGVTEYAATCGFWRYANAAAGQRGYSFSVIDTGDIRLMGMDGRYGASTGEFESIGFHVPKAGSYTLTVYPSRGSGFGEYYVGMFPASETNNEIRSAMSSAGNRLGTIEFDSSVADLPEVYTYDVTVENPGEYLLVFQKVKTDYSNDTYARIDKFTLTAGDGSQQLPMSYVRFADKKNWLTVGETSTVEHGLILNSGTRDAYSGAKTVVYYSKDDSVATVNGTTVTAVAPGVTEIYATVDGYPIAGTKLTVEESLGATVAFQGVDIPAGSITGASGNGSIEQIAVGTEITLTKPADENFRYFRIGGTKSGKAILDNTYTFTLVSPTCVTAVYDNPGDVKLELWGPNNTIIDVLGEGTNPFEADLSSYAPRYAGYTFNGWKFEDGSSYNGGLVDNVKRVVADFTKDADQSVSGITVGGSAKAAENNVAISHDLYSVGITISEATWWRDGTIVFRGSSYTHYPWTATNITPDIGFVEYKLSPKVLLTRHASRGTEFMLEYNAFNATFVEAGIVFGATENVKLGACYNKASTQDSATGHGQMTARSADATNAKYARGYLVYNDGENTRVVYTDAQQIAAE